jgi:hypothetical protein
MENISLNTRFDFMHKNCMQRNILHHFLATPLMPQSSSGESNAN